MYLILLVKGIASSLLSVREAYDLSSNHLPLIASLTTSPHSGAPIRTLVPPGANIRLFQDELVQCLYHQYGDQYSRRNFYEEEIAASGGAVHIRNVRSSIALPPEAVGLLTFKKQLRRSWKKLLPIKA